MGYNVKQRIHRLKAAVLWICILTSEGLCPNYTLCSVATVTEKRYSLSLQKSR